MLFIVPLWHISVNLGQISVYGSICTKVLCIVPNYQFDPILTTYLCLWYNLYQSAVYCTTLQEFANLTFHFCIWVNLYQSSVYSTTLQESANLTFHLCIWVNLYQSPVYSTTLHIYHIDFSFIHMGQFVLKFCL